MQTTYNMFLNTDIQVIVQDLSKSPLSPLMLLCHGVFDSGIRRLGLLSQHVRTHLSFTLGMTQFKQSEKLPVYYTG